MIHRLHRTLYRAVVPVAWALVALAGSATADEIELIDLETCERSTQRVHEVTAEDWKWITYRERERGPDLKIETIRVVDIKRTAANDRDAETIRNGLIELARQNYAVASAAFRNVCGGGWRTDSGTGERIFTSYASGDPTKANQRPDWRREYSHFFYAKALAQKGHATKSEAELEEALLALDDVPVPGAKGDENATSGGFLGRFANGNSRWYPEALTLKAQVLVDLKRYDEAAKTFTELGEAVIRAGLAPRWAYEASIGTGVIAEAQGKTSEAIDAYTAAANRLRVLLESETRRCLQLELGRYYSRARMRAGAVKLADAEKAKSVQRFEGLRRFIEEGLPESLRKEFSGKQSKTVVEALVSGARDPEVQAVALNGLGLANLMNKKYEDALLAFKAVTVKHFQVREQAARAHYYLAEAAGKAAEAAKPDAKSMYEAMRGEAIKTLQADYADTPWAKK